MDVANGSLYPVFDVHRVKGHAGLYTFPDMARRPSGNQRPRNQFTITTGDAARHRRPHTPAGLYDELDLIRAEAGVRGGAIPGSVPHSVRLFRSREHYLEKRGPISWDMAMTATSPGWRP